MSFVCVIQNPQGRDFIVLISLIGSLSYTQDCGLDLTKRVLITENINNIN